VERSGWGYGVVENNVCDGEVWVYRNGKHMIANGIVVKVIDVQFEKLP
jgi:hypothetical protein